ncbi:hypothetical protein O1L44_21340 [Streptomyces noursei]|nr:hypothetical protein [Streptomyces noursei]
MHARTHRATLSADLSGSLDSTSLCFLAARDSTELITTAWEGRDPADDDPLWSAHSAYRLSRVRQEGRHLSLPYTDAPTWYTPPAQPAHRPGRPAGRRTGRGPAAAPGAAGRQVRVPDAPDRHRRRRVFAPRPVALNSLARGDFREALRLARRARRLAPGRCGPPCAPCSAAAATPGGWPPAPTGSSPAPAAGPTARTGRTSRRCRPGPIRTRSPRCAGCCARPPPRHLSRSTRCAPSTRWPPPRYGPASGCAASTP